MNKILSKDERQDEAKIKWIKNKCCGTFNFATGFGKTVTALKCIKAVLNKYPTFKVLIVVPTDNLKSQWESILLNNNLENNAVVSVINSVIKKIWEVDILVLDECHKYLSRTFVQVFKVVKYKLILGLTATFERLDGKHVILNKYCPVIDKISIEEAVKNHWLSNYTEYQVLIDVDDIEDYFNYNYHFTEHFEFFSFSFPTAMSCIGPKSYIFRNKLRDSMCSNPEDRAKMGKLILYHSVQFNKYLQKRKSFINNHPKKIEIARKIINARINKKIITISNSIKMAESIKIGKVYSSKNKKKEAENILEEFNKCTSGVINSSKKLIEGADIDGLSVAIILGLNSSLTRSVQSNGRVIRYSPGKKAEIFNIVINNTVETRWFEESHKNLNYITIDEEGLEDVLAGREPKPYKKKIDNLTFRF